jgi:hypothetical protein
MTQQTLRPQSDKTKASSITFLYVVAALITISGIGYAVYCLIFNVTLPVMGNQIHGAIFGTVIGFLGVRYLLSVRQLKQRVFGTDSVFTWKSFRAEKLHAAPSKKDEKKH